MVLFQLGWLPANEMPLSESWNICANNCYDVISILNVNNVFKT